MIFLFNRWDMLVGSRVWLECTIRISSLCTFKLQPSQGNLFINLCFWSSSDISIHIGPLFLAINSSTTFVIYLKHTKVLFKPSKVTCQGDFLMILPRASSWMPALEQPRKTTTLPFENFHGFPFWSSTYETRVSCLLVSGTFSNLQKLLPTSQAWMVFWHSTTQTPNHGMARGEVSPNPNAHNRAILPTKLGNFLGVNVGKCR